MSYYVLIKYYCDECITVQRTEELLLNHMHKCHPVLQAILLSFEFDSEGVVVLQKFITLRMTYKTCASASRMGITPFLK